MSEPTTPIERVKQALAACGLDPSLVRELPADTSTAEAAARAVNAPLGSIVKSLVFLADWATEGSPDRRESRPERVPERQRSGRSASGVDGASAERMPLLVLVAGDQRADVRRLRAVLGLSKKRLRIAQPAEVLDSIGFEVGGVPPVGHDQRESRPEGVPERQRSGRRVGEAGGVAVRTLIDRTLGRFEVVWAAAGSPNAVFPIAFDQLVAITHGEVIDLIEET